jgi:hypothetical protein
MTKKPHPLVIVRNSAIAGRGAFARRAIPKGKRIIEYTGKRRLETDEDDEIGPEPVYIFGVGKGMVIDPDLGGGNEARYLNHSCKPNCETIDEEGRIFIEAMRAIEEGEELTFDYLLEVGHPISERDRKAYPCRCGTVKCRKTLLAPPKKKRKPAAKKKIQKAKSSATKRRVA